MLIDDCILCNNGSSYQCTSTYPANDEAVCACLKDDQILYNTTQWFFDIYQPDRGKFKSNSPMNTGEICNPKFEERNNTVTCTVNADTKHTTTCECTLYVNDLVEKWEQKFRTRGAMKMSYPENEKLFCKRNCSDISTKNCSYTPSTTMAPVTVTYNNQTNASENPIENVDDCFKCMLLYDLIAVLMSLSIICLVVIIFNKFYERKLSHIKNEYKNLRSEMKDVF